MKLQLTQSYQVKDVKFAEVYEFAEGRVDIQLSFTTDNPFEPVALSFQIDKEKCREMAKQLLAIADKLDKCKPPKLIDLGDEPSDPADFWKKE